MTIWPPGDLLSDSYAIAVDPDAPSGPYTLVVGLYDEITGQRLSLTAPAGAQGDHIILETVIVEAAN